MARHLLRRCAILATLNAVIGMSRSLRYGVLLCLAVGIALSGMAAEEKKLEFTQCEKNDQHGSAVFVLDLTKEVTDANATDVAFLIDSSHPELLAKLDVLLQDCPKIDLQPARLFLKEARAASLSNRLIEHAGDHLKFYVFVVGRLANVKIHEVVRKTAIRDDIGTLIDLLKQLRKAGGTAAAEVTVWTADYVLQEERALADVNVVPFTDDPNGGDPKEGMPVKVATIITGPGEHFRLSANVPVNSVKMVDYDQDKQKLTLKDTPREFMLGGDWYFGDVLAKQPLYDWHRLGGKGLIRFSKQPLDALGLAAAYRANAFSIIAGRFWNRQTKKIGANPDGTDQITAVQNR